MGSPKLNNSTAGSKMRVLDLFAGTGAFSRVFEEFGHTVVFANDIEASSEKIYKLNFPNHNFVLGDLNAIDTKEIPAHDVLCGGFPCQPFSIAGKREGFADKRSDVIWKMLKIIRRHKPKILLLENVKNLLTHDGGQTFQTIIKCIEKLGYRVEYQVLDTAKHSEIPQHRERVYIVGTRGELVKPWLGLNQGPNKKIKEYLEENPESKYYYGENYLSFDKIKNEVKKSVEEHNVLYQYRRYYVRENKSNVCPTLTANMGSGGHNVPLLLDARGIRKLTPRECFNLQGFGADFKLPTDVSDSKLYKLAGNAVSVPIIRLIVKQIVKASIKD